MSIREQKFLAVFVKSRFQGKEVVVELKSGDLFYEFLSVTYKNLLVVLFVLFRR